MQPSQISIARSNLHNERSQTMIRKSSIMLSSVTLALTAIASEANAQTAGYAISPASPSDLRNSFQTPQGAVYVVDNAKGAIVMCYPDNKDNKWLVFCTPATALPK
jgi:hypothetical protein